MEVYSLCTELILLFSCLTCQCISLKIQVFKESVAFPFLYPDLFFFRLLLSGCAGVLSLRVGSSLTVLSGVALWLRCLGLLERCLVEHEL